MHNVNNLAQHIATVMFIFVPFINYHPHNHLRTTITDFDYNQPLIQQYQVVGDNKVFLPLIETIQSTPPPTPSNIAGPIINIPYLPGEIDFPDTTVFWFGKVTPEENYADVRIAYNQTELYVYMSAFDRRLLYDQTPSPDQLTEWDSISLLLDLNSSTPNTPNQHSYQFVAQFTPFPEWENRTEFQQAYIGNGSGWSPSTIPFKSISGWRGDAWNNDIDDRGWVMTFHIPFSSLGNSTPPQEGSIWRMGLVLHDRDDLAGTFIPDTFWPTSLDIDAPPSYGYLRFGMPIYNPPQTATQNTVTIRQGLNGAVVQDAAVGGTTSNLCNADGDFWNSWGNANFAGSADFNIQNQSDIADWPCFAKYYVTFPMDSIPQDSRIISAKLVLHQWGNSGPLELAQPSMIHVLTVSQDWNESTLTWNNAPLAGENITQLLVPTVNCSGSSGLNWPCFPREWDVSRAAAMAQATGSPLRLVLYSTDSDYHSGKLFTTSDVDEWNEVGRPTLIVTWGK